MVVEFEGKKIEFEEVVDVFDVHGPYCKEVEVQGDDEDDCPSGIYDCAGVCDGEAVEVS